jgi:hypothetical protein
MDDVQFEVSHISKETLTSFEEIYNREKEKMIQVLLEILNEKYGI